MSMSLEEARSAIRDVDKQMAELFVRRMRAAEAVAAYKKEHALPIYDKAQEERVLERSCANVTDPHLQSYYIHFVQHLMDLSKQYQHRLVDGMTVAYCGVEGAFAHIAARRIFPDAQLLSCPSFGAAYESVLSGESNAAVLPIENSYAGEVGAVMDLMFEGALHINGIYTLPISQNLLGIPGADVKNIKKVVSHPQALSQCEQYIKRRGWKVVSAENTAVAAYEVAQMNDPTVAAVASAETAELYGLQILDHDINESQSNTTKFAVFSRVDNAAAGNGGSQFTMIFTVKDEAGSLARAINVISESGFNMKVLRSHPAKGRAWEFFFFTEVEGNASSPQGQKMLSELRSQCEKLRVVGQYAGEIDLREVEKT